MRYEAIQGWFALLQKMQNRYLMIVPERSDRVLSREADGSRRDFSDVIRDAGFRQIACEPIFRDDNVRELVGGRTPCSCSRRLRPANDWRARSSLAMPYPRRAFSSLIQARTRGSSSAGKIVRRSRCFVADQQIELSGTPVSPCRHRACGGSARSSDSLDIFVGETRSRIVLIASWRTVGAMECSKQSPLPTEKAAAGRRSCARCLSCGNAVRMQVRQVKIERCHA